MEGKGVVIMDIINELKELKALYWNNDNLKLGEDKWDGVGLTMEDIVDAKERLERFAPLIMEYFEDTRELNGIIESPLKRLDKMEESLKKEDNFKGKLFLKLDSHLPIAGSIKARGGIYEVLYHAEELALKEGLITLKDDYRKLSQSQARELFSKHKIQVGSTGNLGLSIGITSAALGFNVIVHMSSDAKKWKKDLLREKGATVIEYDGDFTLAVNEGRRLSDLEENSYFVDDENSVNLFLGYAVAALRLKEQLEKENIIINESNPAFFYLPCGVGGSPGGIAFGVKRVFGDNAHVFFIEPTHAPSMLLGMATGKDDEISVQDIGIDGVTEADGLAVGRPSKFVGKIMRTLLSGIFTIEDKNLFNYMRRLYDMEGIKIEPSATSTFEGPIKLFNNPKTKEYLKRHNLEDKANSIIHFAWATGGRLVPEDIMEGYLNTHLGENLE